MREIRHYFTESLGVKPPDTYLYFMEHHQRKLAEDPVTQESWISGLGNALFVVGNTQAFRSTVEGFSKENIIIGYAGTKLIKEINEEIDVFVMLDTTGGGVYLVDSFGITQALAANFQDWIQHRLNEALLKDKYRSVFYAIAFDAEDKAKDLGKGLMQMQHDHLVDLEDAVVVIRKLNGKLKTKHLHSFKTKELVGGGLTGLVVGALCFHPLIGAALGAATELLSVEMSEFALDDAFVKELACALKPGTSALFVLVRKADPEKVRPELEGMGGKVLMTSLSAEQEAALQSVLDSAPPVQPQPTPA